MFNAQGDVVALVDGTGKVVVEYSYDAWGQPLTITGSMKDTLGKANPLRYRCYVYDEETGMYYLGSRYYNPVMGRFINADVYILTGKNIFGSNLFAYCENNPVNHLDPTGHFVSELLDWFGSIGEAVKNTVARWAPAYSVCGGAAIADGPLPIGDVLGFLGAIGVTFGAVGYGIYRTFAKSDSKADSKSNEKAVIISQRSKKQAYFTVNPYNFRPKGLTMREYPGSHNGRIIEWRDPVSNAKIFEWDEDFRYGAHYYAMMVEWNGKHGGLHYLPGSPVPEPWNSIYFGE